MRTFLLADKKDDFLKISLIIPCYNEEDNIKEIAESVYAVLKKIQEKDQAFIYEFIFVDDGSTDSTREILFDIAKRDEKIKYILFSRNFGKESAILAGLTYSSGDAVIIMDADLQHPPDMIDPMLNEYKRGYDQVIARRDRKGETFSKTLFSKLFYKLSSKMMDVKLQDGVGDFRLLSRRAVDAVLHMNEYFRFSKGIFSWIGFKQKIIEYENHPRYAGNTKWGMKSLLAYALDGILSFNNKPLRICMKMGAVLIAGGVAYIFWNLVLIAMNGIVTPGYFTIVAAIIVIGGVQLFSIGVLGEYIGRIYFEVKKRPHYIVEGSNITPELQKESRL